MSRRGENIHKRKDGRCSKEKCFSEVLSLWMESNSLKQKDATKMKYQFLITQHINPEIGYLAISEINTVVINRFLYQKQQNGRLDKKGGLSSASIKVMISIIKSAFQFAAEQNYCNPVVLNINNPKLCKKELNILDINDQIKLETSILKDCSTTGLGILLSLNTGLRIGEVCALEWSHINFEKKIIYVRQTISRILTKDSECKARTCLIIEKPKTA